MDSNRGTQISITVIHKGYTNMSFENFINRLDKLEIDYIIDKDKDVIIDSKKIAIEYCMFKEHCEAISGLHRNHHAVKQKKYMNAGYNLYVIFEDEFLNKEDITISRIKNFIGKNDGEKIYARNCFVEEITARTSSDFVTEFHIQGNAGSRVKLGLFSEDTKELISVMTFGILSRAKGNKNASENKGSFELVRFCTNNKYRCIGAAGKLMRHFENNYQWDKILTFADRRWSPTGNLYEKIGFELHSITEPNYYYLKVPEFNHRIHRFAFRRDVLREKALKEGTIPEREIMLMTEFQLAVALGYDRIFDCGNYRFVKVNKL